MTLLESEDTETEAEAAEETNSKDESQGKATAPETAAANKEQEHHLFRVRECLVLRKTQIL
jgi:hypothetical protein